MDLETDELLVELKENLLGDMREYLEEEGEDEEVEYDETYVRRFADPLDEHLVQMQQAADRESGMAAVQETVLALNALNEEWREW